MINAINHNNKNRKTNLIQSLLVEVYSCLSSMTAFGNVTYCGDTSRCHSRFLYTVCVIVDKQQRRRRRLIEPNEQVIGRNDCIRKLSLLLMLLFYVSSVCVEAYQLQPYPCSSQTKNVLTLASSSSISTIRQRTMMDHTTRMIASKSMDRPINHQRHRVVSLRTHTLLFLSSTSPEKPNDPRKRNSKEYYKKQVSMFITWFKMKLKTIGSLQHRIRRSIVQFKSLSKRSQQLIMIQIFFGCFLGGSAIRNIYQTTGPPPAIEIPYSTFLDYLEQKIYWEEQYKYIQKLQLTGKQSTLQDLKLLLEEGTNPKLKLATNSYFANTKFENIPLIAKIRISSDRFVYRLYPNPFPNLAALTTSSTTTTTTAIAPSIEKTTEEKVLSSSTSRNMDTTTSTTRKEEQLPVTTKVSPTIMEHQQSTDVKSKTETSNPSTPPPTLRTRIATLTSSSSSFSIISRLKNKVPSKKKLSPLSLSSSSSIGSLSSKQRRQFQRIQQSPYIVAYTRSIPVSSMVSTELIQTFRQADISFTALPMAKASPISVVLRTVLAVFYFMVLFRLYKTISGATGSSSSNKGDTPGKVATNDITAQANFNDIQGIDDAKYEVMELVDSLRHPEKYALLGARPPTGLLLEGPPGTGKKRKGNCNSFLF
jgi:hypothetical protein